MKRDLPARVAAPIWFLVRLLAWDRETWGKVVSGAWVSERPSIPDYDDMLWTDGCEGCGCLVGHKRNCPTLQSRPPPPTPPPGGSDEATPSELRSALREVIRLEVEAERQSVFTSPE